MKRISLLLISCMFIVALVSCHKRDRFAEEINKYENIEFNLLDAKEVNKNLHIKDNYYYNAVEENGKTTISFYEGNDLLYTKNYNGLINSYNYSWGADIYAIRVYIINDNFYYLINYENTSKVYELDRNGNEKVIFDSKLDYEMKTYLYIYSTKEKHEFYLSYQKGENTEYTLSYCRYIDGILKLDESKDTLYKDLSNGIRLINISTNGDIFIQTYSRLGYLNGLKHEHTFDNTFINRIENADGDTLVVDEDNKLSFYSFNIEVYEYTRVLKRRYYENSIEEKYLEETLVSFPASSAGVFSQLIDIVVYEENPCWIFTTRYDRKLGFDRNTRFAICYYNLKEDKVYVHYQKKAQIKSIYQVTDKLFINIEDKKGTKEVCLYLR